MEICLKIFEWLITGIVGSIIICIVTLIGLTILSRFLGPGPT